MKALVTGASGFVGAHLVRHLLEREDEVLGTGLSSGAPAGAPDGLRFVGVDLREASVVADVVRSFSPDVIYHLGGIAFVPQADLDFELTLAVNVGGTHSVFKAASLLAKPVKVVLVSTGEVYGKVSSAMLPVSEETPVNPANSYSLTKVMAESVARRYGVERRVEYVIMRPFNHLGAGQDDRFVASTFARQLARIAVGKAPPTISVGNLDAERDFSDVRDIVVAYRLAGSKERPDGEELGRIYNLGSGRPVAIKTLLDMLLEISGVEVSVVPDPARLRPSENPIVFSSVERARRELGWSSRYSLEETLQSVYQYWFDRESGGRAH